MARNIKSSCLSLKIILKNSESIIDNIYVDN
jgi:hypothetical protein